MSGRKVIIILGPTAVGKTSYAIEKALEYSSPVISCDSRQIYREMSIGTAVPTEEQLKAVTHHFIHTHSIFDSYTAGQYELDAIALCNELFAQGHETLVMCGGSGFYIDAFCNGLDAFPDADPVIRKELDRMLREQGVEALAEELKSIDPESCEVIDLKNGQRVVRALEVYKATGRKFSSFKTSRVRERDFEIEKIGLCRPREILYERIDRRVDEMIAQGLEEEARRLYPHRDLPALRTVGYKEFFLYFDGQTSLERAIEDIKTHSRNYARKQMTYWRRDKSIKWIEMHE